jgi:ribosomal protein L24E
MEGRNKVFYCSFCGRSNEEAGRMLVKSDRQVLNRQVKICLECAQLAIKAITELQGK